MGTVDSFYEKVFGERWHASLKPALEQTPSKVYLANPFTNKTDLMISDEPVAGAYALDRASLEPVYAMGLTAGAAFLDLCSAPGGKALMALYMTRGEVVAHLNDSSSARVQRLKAVLYDHLPEEMVGRLTVTCRDGARFGQQFPETFDCVLADVPCSSDRHHLLHPKEEEWNEGKSKRLAIRQHALLCAAIDATKPGGTVVYSTCSLSPHENDGVIQKLHKSRADKFSVELSTREMGEPTTHGRLILPDHHPSFGPIYYSIIKKL